jgi:CubicO group peptidase (beta-lactamase class C family)
MAAHVGAGRLPGLVSLVACGEDVHVDTIGSPSVAGDAPLARDAIFRIASLTKPITAAATLSLVEEGRLRLEQPIDELVPELAGRRVLRAIDSELDDTVPAHRPITLEDLLSYRLGLGSVMAPPGTYPIQRAEAELGLQSIGGPPWPPVTHDVDGWIGALGSLPLMHQPGERWLYNTSAQVLGVLLARACGGDLQSVLRERVFEPLGMVDTGFTVPAERLSRFTMAYRPDPETGELAVLDDPARSWWSTPPSFPDASGWLVSTIDDYWSFVSMLLAGGTGNGARILSPATVARRPAHAAAAGSRSALPGRARRVGARPGGARDRLGAPTAPVRHRLGRRHRHHLAHEPRKRRHWDPVYPASGHVAGASPGGRRLLGRDQRRHRDPVTVRARSSRSRPRPRRPGRP